MDFLLNDDQKALREQVIELCENRLRPLEERIGENNVTSREIAREMARAGLFRLFVPGEFGNSTPMPSLVTICMVREQLALRCRNAELIFTVQGLGSYPIVIAGNQEQKAKYCPWIVSGEKLFAFALTEPASGSDAAALETVAAVSGEHYIVNGRKKFISLAPDADIYTVMVKTTPTKGSKGISALIMEKNLPGFDPGERMELIAAHPIGAPVFRDCRVPRESLIGEQDRGFKIAMRTLDFFRSTVGAGAVGMAQTALDEAICYAIRRTQFGRPIADFQAIRMKLAAMATELDAARLLVYRAAYLKDHGQDPITKESSMAKLYATEAAQRIIDQALQIHGGSGVVKGSILERLYREIRPLRVYEGTSEIQHLVIAGLLLKNKLGMDRSKLDGEMSEVS
jgi:acyl-CoA dehydrogenase